MSNHEIDYIDCHI